MHFKFLVFTSYILVASVIVLYAGITGCKTASVALTEPPASSLRLADGNSDTVIFSGLHTLLFGKWSAVEVKKFDDPAPLQYMDIKKYEIEIMADGSMKNLESNMVYPPGQGPDGPSGDWTGRIINNDTLVMEWSKPVGKNPQYVKLKRIY